MKEFLFKNIESWVFLLHKDSVPVGTVISHAVQTIVSSDPKFSPQFKMLKYYD